MSNKNKSNIKKPRTFNTKLSEKKMKRAKVEFDKVYKEIAPFIPKSTQEETTTEGEWKTSENLLSY